MFFGKKDKRKPSERVEDLKARVDALRQADEARRDRSYSLDHFLEGDDVLTGRDVQDSYEAVGMPEAETPSTPEAMTDDYEAALAAELEKYLRREQDRVSPSDLPVEGDREGAQSDPVPLPRVGDSRDRDGDHREEEAGDEPESGWKFKNWPVEEDWPPKERAG